MPFAAALVRAVFTGSDLICAKLHRELAKALRGREMRPLALSFYTRKRTIQSSHGAHHAPL